MALLHSYPKLVLLWALSNRRAHTQRKPSHTCLNCFSAKGRSASLGLHQKQSAPSAVMKWHTAWQLPWSFPLCNRLKVLRATEKLFLPALLLPTPKACFPLCRHWVPWPNGPNAWTWPSHMLCEGYKRYRNALSLLYVTHSRLITIVSIYLRKCFRGLVGASLISITKMRESCTELRNLMKSWKVGNTNRIGCMIKWKQIDTF